MSIEMPVEERLQQLEFMYSQIKDQIVARDAIILSLIAHLKLGKSQELSLENVVARVSASGRMTSRVEVELLMLLNVASQQPEDHLIPAKKPDTLN